MHSRNPNLYNKFILAKKLDSVTQFCCKYTVFLGYPEAIRKVIYTTNSVESVNSQLRKVTKS
ncbi:transposase [Candidatus Tisiphia endosymbiont of Parasteatoda lunata]|uniref:transposase n=1 Tax=Candidatus Tisiphia endosymbiont of Parasteatoda lunata TaxID=3066275 RepID=UPI003977C30B